MAMLAATPVTSSNRLDYLSFVKQLVFRDAGILLLSTLLTAVSMGSLIGVTPETLSDRYAHIKYGYASNHTCYEGLVMSHETVSLYVTEFLPPECQEGSEKAQRMAAWSTLVTNALALLWNPVLGAWSDRHGRKPVLLLGYAFNWLSSAVFVILLLNPRMSPFGYYFVNSLTGIVGYLSIPFAYLSDVIVDKEYRAAAFGLFLAIYSGGFALASSIPLVLDHTRTAILSATLNACALGLAFFFLPETVKTTSLRTESITVESETNFMDPIEDPGTTTSEQTLSLVLWKFIQRPFQDMRILMKDKTLQLVACASFVSALVFSTDATLLIYYLEEHLNVQDSDIASLFLLLGIAGVVIQGGFLEPLKRLLGEKGLCIFAFVCGSIHNMLYGLARHKLLIFVAFVVCQFTHLGAPVLSSIASKHVENEQGRLQGALVAVNSVSLAIGPLWMEWLYARSKSFFPGFMFVFAGFLYMVGAIFVVFLPGEMERTTPSIEGAIEVEDDPLQEPLLGSDSFLDDQEDAAAS